MNWKAAANSHPRLLPDAVTIPRFPVVSELPGSSEHGLHSTQTEAAHTQALLTFIPKHLKARSSQASSAPILLNQPPVSLNPTASSKLVLTPP